MLDITLQLSIVVSSKHYPKQNNKSKQITSNFGVEAQTIILARTMVVDPV